MKILLLLFFCIISSSIYSQDINTKNNCKNVFYIETEDEISKEMFAFERIGITAGASTPDELICAVENKLGCGIY